MKDRAGTILRKLNPSDLEAAMELSTEAGWNQTIEDWRTLIELSPNGCLAIEVAGELASTATLVCYGQRLAWVGMVLTRIKYRGGGFARRLLMETLDLADRMGIDSVKLDATDQGQPLYETLGFRAEQPVERWWRRGAMQLLPLRTASDAALLYDWKAGDAQAFGVDRSALLRTLATRRPPLLAPDSYLLTRAGREISYLGPSVCDGAATARGLFQRALQTESPGGWYWDLMIENAHAVSIAQELGFVPKRHLLRMVRGRDLRGQEESVYALAGFELG